MIYEIKTTGGITKSLQYIIRKTTPITKGLQYAIRGPMSKTKALKYETVKWYQPAKLDIIQGSIISGILSDVYNEGGNNLLLAETTNNPAFAYDFTFYGAEVHAYDLHIMAKYTGQAGHKVRLQQWNFTTSTRVS